jgi:cell division protein FtsQ
VCVAVVVAAALGWIVLGTSLLGVREVRVTGSVIAGPDQVRAMAAVVEGTPLARVDTDAVRARVRTLPSVADAAVRRAWPTTLVIEVSERVAVATVADGGTFLYLDREGVVFSTSATRPAHLALLRVPSAGPTDPATMAALEVLAALTPQLRERLREIVAESPAAIHLELAGGRRVIWGDATHSAAKAQIATSLLAGSSLTIDVSTPDVVTVR